MTPQKQSRSSALFLTEPTLAFARGCKCACVQIFVKSHLLSLHSRQLNLAVNESAAIAELIEASDSMEEAVALITARYPLAEVPQVPILSKKPTIPLAKRRLPEQQMGR